MTSVWTAFAWDETLHRYRGSALGVAWISVSFVIFVAAIAIFFGGFAAADQTEFLYYVTMGFAAFSFLIANLVDGCDVFRSSATWIKSSPLPYSIYVYKSISRSAFPFMTQFLTAIVLIFLFGWRPNWWFFMAVPAFFVFLLNAIWVQYFFGLITARFGDLIHLVQATTRILFFTTPILWVFEEREGMVRLLATLNPLTHFVEIMRAPVLGSAPSADSWIIVGLITVGGAVMSLMLGGAVSRRLPFWV